MDGVGDATGVKGAFNPTGHGGGYFFGVEFLVETGHRVWVGD